MGEVVSIFRELTARDVGWPEGSGGALLAEHSECKGPVVPYQGGRSGRGCGRRQKWERKPMVGGLDQNADPCSERAGRQCRLLSRGGTESNLGSNRILLAAGWAHTGWQQGRV